MNNSDGNKTTQNILIERMAEQGIDISVRNHDDYMNESMEVRAKHLAKVEMAARQVREDLETNEAESIEKFYSKGNKVD